MATRLTKIPALQGTNSVADGQSVDFTIDASAGVIDPTRSYISFIAGLSVDPANGVQVLYANWAGNAPLRNTALIGDYELRSARGGLLESILSSNVPNSCLDMFSRDWEQVASDNYKTLAAFEDPVALSAPAGGLVQGIEAQGPLGPYPFATPWYTGAGGTGLGPFLGGAVTQEIKIPLAQLSPLMRGLPGGLDCGALGPLRLRARVDLSAVGFGAFRPYTTMWDDIGCSNMAAASNDVATAPAGAAGWVINAGDLEIVNGSPVLLRYTAGGVSSAGQRLVTADPAVNVGTGVATITLGGAQVPNGATAVAISLIVGPMAGLATETPAAAAPYVDIGASDVGRALMETAYLGRHIGVVYPVAGGGTIWDTRAVTAVTTPAAGMVRLTLSAALGADATGAATVYILRAPALGWSASAVNTITFNATTVAALRLWAGAAVRLTATTGNGAKEEQARTIVSVTQNGANVDVLLNGVPPAGDGRFRLQIQPPGDITLALSNPTLALRTMAGPAPSEAVTTTLSVEIAGVPAGTREYQRMFETDPGCGLVHFALVDRAAGDLVGFRNAVSSYRMRLDDGPVTAAAVVPFDARHQDGMIQALTRSGVASLRSFGPATTPTATLATDGTQYQKAAPFLMSVIVDPSRAHRVQLTLTFGGGPTADEYTLYALKECQRVAHGGTIS